MFVFIHSKNELKTVAPSAGSGGEKQWGKEMNKERSPQRGADANFDSLSFVD